MGGVHASPGEYQEPHLPDGVLEIRLSVYKLNLTGVGFLDSLGASLAGAYHSALVVAGEEWSYGGHDEDSKTGVYRCRPEINPEYIFYQRIVMAQVRLSRSQALSRAHALAHAPEWSGARYDLIEHNCNHFASDLCWLLAKKRPPDWVNETADSLAKRRRRRRGEEAALADALFQYRQEHGTVQKHRTPRESTLDEEPDAEPEADPHVRDAPGTVAFQDTFTTTFEMAWSQGREGRRARLASCQADQDPHALRLQVEKESLEAAASAAITAAEVVAAAARSAASARVEQPAAGLRAWDASWAQQSGPLLRKWREAAVKGRLGPAGAVEREEEVAVALAIAAVAAAEAAQVSQQWPAFEEPRVQDPPAEPVAEETPAVQEVDHCGRLGATSPARLVVMARVPQPDDEAVLSPVGLEGCPKVAEAQVISRI